MKLRGQRWQYRVGNSTVNVDNAWSFTFWAQERLIVNDETVRRTGAFLALRRSYDEPWLTMIGEDELLVRMSAGVQAVLCKVTLGGEELEPDALFEATWTGPRHTWPEGAAWIETDALTFGL